MLRIYSDRYSPHARAVRIVLHETGLAHEAVELGRDAPRPAEIAGLTPPDAEGPVLFVSRDFILWDATAIIYWLTQAYPCSVTASSLDARAKEMAWVAWSQRFLYGPLLRLSRADLVAKQQAEQTFRDVLPPLEGLLADDEWLVKNDFSVADIALAPPLVALPRSLAAAMPKRVRSYIDRLRHRPSVHAVCELGEVDSRPSWAA